MPALLLKRFLAFVIDLALIVDYAVVLFLAGNFQTNNAKEKMVMPNHFHCIVENMDIHVVGAPLCGRPESVPRSSTDHKYGMENHIFGATVGEVMD